MHNDEREKSDDHQGLEQQGNLSTQEKHQSLQGQEEQENLHSQEQHQTNLQAQAHKTPNAPGSSLTSKTTYLITTPHLYPPPPPPLPLPQLEQRALAD